MKRTITQILLLISTSYCQSQIVTSTNVEEYNNVKASLTDGGIYFNNFTGSTPGYEIPKGSGKNAIFTSAFWYGGEDASGNLKMSAQLNTPNTDIFTGPYSSTNSYSDPNYIAKYSPSIWKVKRSDIEQHILNYGASGYITPPSILNWPGNGDPTLGVSQQLAPFIDLDNDGNYEPTSGDYPEIKGCEASFIIVNDYANIHLESSAEPIGIEVHLMIYQYATNDYLNNTTFISKKIINRGTQTLNNFSTAFFMDADLGNPSDDFVGCDSIRNIMYSYNGDSNDETSGGSMGYGENLPCIGVLSLNNNLVNSGYFTGGGFPYTAPVNSVEYWNYMQGKWANGTPMTYGGTGHDVGATIPCSFMFPGNSLGGIFTGEEWSEITEGNPSGDRRQYMTVKSGLFQPGDTLNLDYAILFAQDTNWLESVNVMLDIADSVQLFYNSNIDECTNPPFVGISEINEIDFKVYPNPTKGAFIIEFENTMEEIKMEILDMSGRIVLAQNYKNKQTIEVDLKEQSGMYFVKLENKSGVFLRKLIIE